MTTTLPETVHWSIVYIFFRAISRTTSTFWVISQENVFESSLAKPENRIYHRWYTFHETNPADEKNNTVTGKHSLVYSNIARAKPKLKIQIVGGWLRLGSELWTLNFEILLQQHLLCGVSGWRGERAGRLSQPADSWTLPQFLILWQLPEENSNQG